MRSRRIVYPLVFVAIYASLFAIYLLWWVPVRQAELTARAFRVLAFASGQIQSRIDSFANTVETEAARAGLAPQNEAAKGDQSGRAQLSLVPRQASYGLELQATFPNRKTVREERAIADIVGAFLRAIPAELFDEVTVASGDGTVLYQRTQQSGVLLSNMAALFDQANTTPAETGSGAKTTATLADMSRLVDVPLAGARYKLFLQPVPLTLPRAGRDEKGAPEPARLVLCGLLSANRLWTRSLALPSRYIVMFGFGIAVALVVFWPVLKLNSMGPAEGFRPAEVVSVTISILLAAQLLTLLVLYLTGLWDTRSIEQRLVGFADAIERNTATELDQALETLRELSQPEVLGPETEMARARRKAGKKDDQDFNTSPNLLFTKSHPKVAPIVQRRYPYLDQVIWTDWKGDQKVKWSVEQSPTGWVRMGRYPWFADLVAGRLWELPPVPGSTPPAEANRRFRVASQYSANTGQYLTLVVQPLEGRDPLAVGMLVTSPLSLIAPVIPAGLGFAVVDDTGKVVFHSRMERNSREDFFREFEPSREIRAAVGSGTQAFFAGHYQGNPHVGHVRPFTSIRKAPWSLVVFEDVSAREQLYMRGLIGALLWLGPYYLYVAILLIAGFLRLARIDRSWYWPTKEKLPTLNFLTVIFILLGFGFTLALRSQPEATWLELVVAPPVAISAILLTLRQRRTETMPRVLARFPAWGNFSGYITTWTCLLVLLAIFPSVALFRLAYEQKRPPFRAEQDLALKKNLAAREDQVQARYRNVKTDGKDLLPANDEQFLDARRKQTLDRYDLALASGANPEPLDYACPNRFGLALLFLLTGGLWGTVRYTTRKRFAVRRGQGTPWMPISLAEPPPAGENLLIIGLPRTGRSKLIRAWPECQIVDIADRLRRNDWTLEATKPLVVLDQFESGMDDPSANENKLRLIEFLVEIPNVQAVIITAVDPLFYLFGEHVADPGSIGPDVAMAHGGLYGWATALSSFKHVLSTCKQQGVCSLENCQRLWITCTRREKISLLQLADDGFVNPRNHFVLHHLLRRQLVKVELPDENVYSIVDDSLREFVCSDLARRQVEGYCQAETDTAWRGVKRVLRISILAAACFLLIAFQDFLQAGMGLVTSVLALVSGALTAVPKALDVASRWRSGRSEQA